MGSIILLAMLPLLPMTEAFDPVREIFSVSTSAFAQRVGASASEIESTRANTNMAVSYIYVSSIIISIMLILICTTKRNQKLGRYMINTWLILFLVAWILRASKVIGPPANAPTPVKQPKNNFGFGYGSPEQMGSQKDEL